jgi:hypothetical protein
MTSVIMSWESAAQMQTPNPSGGYRRNGRMKKVIVLAAVVFGFGLTFAGVLPGQ